MSALLPEKTGDERVQRSVNLPESVWARLDQIALTSGYRRNEVIERFLLAAIERYEGEGA